MVKTVTAENTKTGVDTRFSEADVTLRDGRVVHLRAILPTDEKELLQAFERMPNEARYMRFMRFVREVNLQRLREALSSFPEGGNGIVARAADDGTDIVASAVFFVGKIRATASSQSPCNPASAVLVLPPRC